MASYRTPLGQVRGLGAAKHGVGHFITQRVTGMALIVLVLWAIAAAIGVGAFSYGDTVAWLRSPWNAVPAALLIGVAFLHMNIGMRTIIEDYVPDPAGKVAFLVLSLFVCWVGGAVGVFSILKVALSGAH